MIKDTILYFASNKWSQYHVLNTNNTLFSYLPATELLTLATLKKFVHKYNSVIIKPCDSQHGTGIVQIAKKGFSSYEIHAGTKIVTKSSLNKTFHYLNEFYLKKKYYLIQQKLPLAKIDKCPIDIRVMTQKSNSNWIVTGKLVKVAEKNFIITNAAQKLLLMNEAINVQNTPNISLQKIDPKIDQLCVIASRQFEKHYPELTIIGFDIGLTRSGEIWIIEANFVPDIAMFNQLHDKNMYKNIVKLKNNPF